MRIVDEEYCDENGIQLHISMEQWVTGSVGGRIRSPKMNKAQPMTVRKTGSNGRRRLLVRYGSSGGDAPACIRPEIASGNWVRFMAAAATVAAVAVAVAVAAAAAAAAAVL
ncbi:hypothetical protein T08_12356 [Trichinella sp. T8]|nr:hypothetical protein T08_12356 [Trichinella sp. T8]